MSNKMLMALTVTMLIMVTTANAQPDTLWTRTFGGNESDGGYSVEQTSDGGYIIAGKTGSYSASAYDVYLIKTDASGTEQWSQNFYSGYDENEQGYSVQQTSDGGYIIAGETGNFGWTAGEVYLIKTDASGNQQWSQTFGSNWGNCGKSVQQTTDDGYVVAGTTGPRGGPFNVYLIKTDANGDTVWTKTFGGSGFDIGESVKQTSDGGYIVTGRTASYMSGYNVYLIKTDVSGTEQWSQTFSGSEESWGESVDQTSDGGYVITGITSTTGYIDADVYIIKTNTTGDPLWTKTIGGSEEDWGESVQQTSDGGYIITGLTYSYGSGGSDVWLISLDAETGVIELDLPQPLTYSLLPAFPNPFNPTTLICFQMPVAGDIQILVYDIQGNVVATLTEGWQIPGSY